MGQSQNSAGVICFSSWDSFMVVSICIKGSAEPRVLPDECQISKLTKENKLLSEYRSAMLCVDKIHTFWIQCRLISWKSCEFGVITVNGFFGHQPRNMKLLENKCSDWGGNKSVWESVSKWKMFLIARVFSFYNRIPLLLRFPNLFRLCLYWSENGRSFCTYKLISFWPYFHPLIPSC